MLVFYSRRRCVFFCCVRERSGFFTYIGYDAFLGKSNEICSRSNLIFSGLTLFLSRTVKIKRFDIRMKSSFKNGLSFSDFPAE